MSRRSSATWGNGTTTNYSYDTLGSLLSVEHTCSDGVISYTYTYNDGGRLATETITRPAKMTRDFRDEDLEFDINNLNQYHAVNGDPVTYDLNGNLTAQGAAIYSFDPLNRMQSASVSGQSIEFQYNAHGQRMSKSVNRNMMTSLYEGRLKILEFDESKRVVKRFVYGPGLDSPILMKSGETDYFYHQDRLNSVIALSDISGNIVEVYDYMPYGKPLNTSSVGNPFLFTGREYDEETDLYFYRARYYDPKTARFLSPDPVGPNGGDLNLYAYCAGDPINSRDPMGLDNVLVDMSLQYQDLAFKSEGYEKERYSKMSDELMDIYNYWTYFGIDEDKKYNKGIPVLNRINDWVGGVDPQPICTDSSDDFSEYLNASDFGELEYYDLKEIGIVKQLNNEGSYLHYGIAVVRHGTDDVVAILDPIQTGGAGFMDIPGQLTIRDFSEGSIYTYDEWKEYNLNVNDWLWTVWTDDYAPYTGFTGKEYKYSPQPLTK